MIVTQVSAVLVQQLCLHPKPQNGALKLLIFSPSSPHENYSQIYFGHLVKIRGGLRAAHRGGKTVCAQGIGELQRRRQRVI